jgi:ankyrin repeat protein
MHMAAMHGDVAILRYFHSLGASVSGTRAQKDGNTPLHLAAMHNTADVVRQLLVWGAEVDARAVVSTLM